MKSVLPAELAARDSVDGALEWWTLAGVDLTFDEAPHNWFNPPPEAVEPPKPPPMPVERRETAHQRATSMRDRAPFGGPKSGWPKTFADFAPFWMSEASLDQGTRRSRVAPRGGEGASLMTLVGMPEDDDRDRLLSGPQGKLLTSFLAAAGQDEAATYIASLLPCRTTAPDWSAAAESGLADFTRHHIALARPQKLLVFGSGLRTALRIDEGETHLTTDSRIPILFAPRLDRLLRQPGQRRQFWNRWLEWTAS